MLNTERSNLNLSSPKRLSDSIWDPKATKWYPRHRC